MRLGVDNEKAEVVLTMELDPRRCLPSRIQEDFLRAY